jgi:hypothetical protein
MAPGGGSTSFARHDFVGVVWDRSRSRPVVGHRRWRNRLVDSDQRPVLLLRSAAEPSAWSLPVEARGLAPLIFDADAWSWFWLWSVRVARPLGAFARHVLQARVVLPGVVFGLQASCWEARIAGSSSSACIRARTCCSCAVSRSMLCSAAVSRPAGSRSRPRLRWSARRWSCTRKAVVWVTSAAAASRLVVSARMRAAPYSGWACSAVCRAQELNVCSRSGVGCAAPARPEHWSRSAGWAEPGAMSSPRSSGLFGLDASCCDAGRAARCQTPQSAHPGERRGSRRASDRAGNG